MRHHQILMQRATTALDQIDAQAIISITAIQFERGHTMSIECALILKADTQSASVFSSKLQSSCGGLMQSAGPAQHRTAGM